MILLVENSRMYEGPLLKRNIEFVCLKPSDISTKTLDKHTLDLSTIDIVLLGNFGGQLSTVDTIRKMFEVPIIAVLENRSVESLINLYLHGVDDVILMDNGIEEIINHKFMTSSN